MSRETKKRRLCARARVFARAQTQRHRASFSSLIWHRAGGGRRQEPSEWLRLDQSILMPRPGRWVRGPEGQRGGGEMQGRTQHCFVSPPPSVRPFLSLLSAPSLSLAQPRNQRDLVAVGAHLQLQLSPASASPGIAFAPLAALAFSQLCGPLRPRPPASATRESSRLLRNMARGVTTEQGRAVRKKAPS